MVPAERQVDGQSGNCGRDFLTSDLCIALAKLCAVQYWHIHRYPDIELDFPTMQ